MNPIFSDNPLEALAVARMFGALQEPLRWTRPDFAALLRLVRLILIAERGVIQLHPDNADDEELPLFFVVHARLNRRVEVTPAEAARASVQKAVLDTIYYFITATIRIPTPPQAMANPPAPLDGMEPEEWRSFDSTTRLVYRCRQGPPDGKWYISACVITDLPEGAETPPKTSELTVDACIPADHPMTSEVLDLLMLARRRCADHAAVKRDRPRHAVKRPVKRRRK